MSDIQCFFIEKIEQHEGPIPVGAMWWAPNSMSSNNPDGRQLCVQTPGGLWMIDTYANNCTRKSEVRQGVKHQCWVRHGEPPNVTVDKNGDTCGCGCSIGIGDDGNGNYKYHGFLRDGRLVDA